MHCESIRKMMIKSFQQSQRLCLSIYGCEIQLDKMNKQTNKISVFVNCDSVNLEHLNDFYRYIHDHDSHSPYMIYFNRFHLKFTSNEREGGILFYGTCGQVSFLQVSLFLEQRFFQRLLLVHQKQLFYCGKLQFEHIYKFDDFGSELIF